MYPSCICNMSLYCAMSRGAATCSCNFRHVCMHILQIHMHLAFLLKMSRKHALHYKFERPVLPLNVVFLPVPFCKHVHRACFKGVLYRKTSNTPKLTMCIKSKNM